MTGEFPKIAGGATARSTDGTAAVEFVLVFPVLLMLLVGVDELGTGIMIDQKTVAASQMVADLIARNKSVTRAQLDDYITAGKLALDPYSTDTLGFDIVSIQYDANNKPQQVWRYTLNMTPNDDGINGAAGLGVSGDGVLAVTVTYNYVPPLGSMVIHSIPMEETAFVRGRESAVINQN
jgi:Flp pilus assembly protein TadG